MKGLGVKNFQQKKYKLFRLPGEWGDFMGDLMLGFICIVYGKSGQGKTEFLVRFAKALTAIGKVGWVSYEQGHGYDLQRAINRNNMEVADGSITFYDPWEKRKPGHSLFEELTLMVSKRNSPTFWFIDSVQDTRFTYEQYKELRNAHKKKCFIWIGHGRGRGHKTQIGVDIEFDGQIGIWVDKYIAYSNKNRLGGMGEYIIWEEKAREKNPLYFEMKARELGIVPAKAKKPRKSKKAANEQ